MRATVGTAVCSGHFRAIAIVRTALGAETTAALIDAGRALPLTTVLEVALRVAVPDDRSTVSHRTSDSDLTPRKLEVLRLLAAGRTDREIAEILFISRRTVNTHVASILAKFGAPTCRDVAARARERGWLPAADVPSRYT